MRPLALLLLFSLPSVATAQAALAPPARADPSINTALEVALAAANNARAEAAQLRASAQEAQRRAACLSRFAARAGRLADALRETRSHPARLRLLARIEAQLAEGPRCPGGLSPGSPGPAAPVRAFRRDLRANLRVREMRSGPDRGDAVLPLRRAMSALRTCIERTWQRDPRLMEESRLTLRYRIGVDGRVSSPEVEGGPEPARACIATQLTRLRHAPAAEPSQATVILVVRATERARPAGIGAYPELPSPAGSAGCPACLSD